MQSSSDKMVTSIHMEELLIKRGATLSSFPTLSLGERIKSGKSILTLNNLVSKEEIEYLIKPILELSLRKEEIRRQNQVILDNRAPGKAYLRMSTIAAAIREQRTDALPEPISVLLEEILERALRYIDQELCPSLRSTLFSDDGTMPMSLAELFRNNQLEFSIREPAINVYTAPHGHFGMHKDNDDLTILIPLSAGDGNDFTGGGTAFWSQSYPKEGMDDPSLIMTPKPGTAMIFGGKVSHKGMHIQSGTRVVFVASFSRPSYGKECDRPSSWRRE